MKDKTLSIRYREYSSEEELNAEERKLLAAAREALRKAYAPYSRFMVGAAVRLENGEIMGGSNQENAAYPMCLCAERTALAAAASRHPDQKVVALAVTSRHHDKELDSPAAPCGACRQVISETEDRFQTPMLILLAADKGPVLRFERGKDLLPLAFSGLYL